MSKMLSKELKLKVLQLYRNILKLHYVKLNEEMRVFGDYFVKSEFTLNYKQADENQIKIFSKHWQDYSDSLVRTKNWKEISIEGNKGIEQLHTKMDIDQRKSLDDLKNIISGK